MSFEFATPARAEQRRDLVAVGAVGRTAVYAHRLLYRYFRDHPLRLRTFGLWRWRWLCFDGDEDIGQALVAQTFT